MTDNEKLAMAMKVLTEEVRTHSRSDAKMWSLIEGHLGEIREQVGRIEDRVTQLEREDVKEMEQRLDKLEKGEARRGGMAAGLGTGAGLLAALLERLVGG